MQLLRVTNNLGENMRKDITTKEQKKQMYDLFEWDTKNERGHKKS